MPACMHEHHKSNFEFLMASWTPFYAQEASKLNASSGCKTIIDHTKKKSGLLFSTRIIVLIEDHRAAAHTPDAFIGNACMHAAGLG
jgi:hypothetical protein